MREKMYSGRMYQAKITLHDDHVGLDFLFEETVKDFPALVSNIAKALPEESSFDDENLEQLVAEIKVKNNNVTIDARKRLAVSIKYNSDNKDTVDDQDSVIQQVYETFQYLKKPLKTALPSIDFGIFEEDFRRDFTNKKKTKTISTKPVPLLPSQESAMMNQELSPSLDYLTMVRGYVNEQLDIAASAGHRGKFSLSDDMARRIFYHANHIGTTLSTPDINCPVYHTPREARDYLQAIRSATNLLKQYAPKESFTVEQLSSMAEQVEKLSQQVYSDYIEGTLGETAPQSVPPVPLHPSSLPLPKLTRKESRLRRSSFYDGMLAQLQELMNTAIASENYEQAVIIRDDMRTYEGKRPTLRTIEELQEVLKRTRNI